LRYSLGLLDIEIFKKEIQTLYINYLMAKNQKDELLAEQKLNELNALPNEDAKRTWIVHKFHDFLKEMEKLYPMGAREVCNDIIVAKAGHTELTSILKHIAKIMIDKCNDTNMLNNKKDPWVFGVFMQKTIDLGPGAMWGRNDFKPTAQPKDVCEDYLIVKHDNNWMAASRNAAANLTEKTTILEIVVILRQKVFDESFEGLAQQAITSGFILAMAVQEILSNKSEQSQVVIVKDPGHTTGLCRKF